MVRWPVFERWPCGRRRPGLQARSVGKRPLTVSYHERKGGSRGFSSYNLQMAFLIDEAFLPATLTAHPMTDEEFAEFCGEHPDLFFEMTSEGELIVMPPTYSLTDARN